VSRTSCILVENEDQVAPLELIQKIREQNPSAQGMAYAVKGSFEVLPEKSLEPLTADEYFSLRSDTKQIGKIVTWWANDQKEGFDELDVQPFNLLVNEADKPVLVMFAEGDFSPLAKAKDPHTDEYRLHLEVVKMVNELVEQNDGDIGKVLAGMQGSMFGKLLDSFSIGRGVITFLAGDGTIFSRVRGNDRGMEAEWGSVSDAYGWRPASAGPAEDTTLLGPAARLRAMAQAKGAVKAVSTQTDPTKMKTKNVLAFEGATSTSAAAVAAATSGGTGPASAPDETTEPTETVTEPDKPQNGVIGDDGLLHPPAGWASLPKNKQNSKMIQRWYRRNNIGRCPLDWEDAWKKRNELPGVKAGQEPWYSEHELKSMEENRKRSAEENAKKAQAQPTPSQGKFKTFSSAGTALEKGGAVALAPAVKGGTSHIVRPDSPEAKAVMARANNPKYDEEFIQKIHNEWLKDVMNQDPVIKALSFDDAVMITPDEINRLDRPKASPLAVLGFKSYADMRWDQAITDSLIEKCVADKNTRYISDIIHDLKYRVCVLENDKIAKQVVSPDTAGKPVGLAARLKQSLGAA
jgi:hypothetical protein